MRPFMKHIGEIWRCANLYRTQQYRGQEIGSYQDSYIINICRHPGIAQDGLAKLIYVHKSNVARQLSSLEEKGFVTRMADPEDKRVLRVYPTEKAKQALTHIRAVHKQWNELIVEGLNEEEREIVAKYAEILAESAKRIVGQEEEGGAE